MSTPDAVWEWIRPPLEELKQGYTDDPGKPWEELRQAFLSELGLQNASQNPVVEQLLEQLDEASEEERNTILGGDELDSLAYEIVQEHTAGDEAAGAGEAGYDEQAWQAYLAENGPQWDGTEESWDQFRQWFGYYADQQGLAAPATALLEYLTPQPAAERIAAFAQYGVTITPAKEAAGQAPAAAAEGEPAEPGEAAGQVPEEAAALSPEQLGSIARELLEENPEFADIPEERRQEIMAEVLSELGPS